MTTRSIRPSRRDLALLRAIADGRCELVADCGPVLMVAGLRCCDQLVARRLTEAGLIDPPRGRRPTPARLTVAGEALLVAA